MYIKQLIKSCCFILLLAGCSPFFYQPLDSQKASLGPETEIKKDLLDLPKPKSPIVAAVYKFSDQTGQYKPSNTGSSWSTAVTQGATNILVRALEESGWFVPIERESISNLLTERKIIRSSREQYNGDSGAKLPPLLYAGILLEGGIVSYETNVFTGGAGVRYFGSDASAQYREDRISIYLRAVSTSNGKILKTIYTTNSIYSQEVSLGVFRYVKFKRLLEAETGYTYNEPTEIAITEAIEKAVHAMIVEGIIDDLWQLNNPTDIKADEIAKYKKEKSDNFKVDHIGAKFEQNYRSGFYSSVLGSTQSYRGDYLNYDFNPGASFNVGFGLSKSFFMEANVGMEQIKFDPLMDLQQYFGDLSFVYLANRKGKFSPYLSVGGGSYYNDMHQLGLSNEMWLPYVNTTAGIEYLFTNKIAVTGNSYVNHLFTDYYDGDKAGESNDFIWGFRFGLKFYIGK
ncbi:CsgG/HfaB family protein [Carboxylicivirga marina]|uniref:CsgG/HfaB family protein n=1 Tax=Carboxylicivirga marina TaxID=2800988 RepID=A0ABS1HIB5_9BACT|nr:CsgG/HfaB family protein [Carboxylicivirga marina]MBK3516949.1 CsgG/HfaB family protein [Carboxylicivirga marina]